MQKEIRVKNLTRISFCDNFYEGLVYLRGEKKMDKKAVLNAYDAFVLSKKAKEHMINNCAQENEIVEILRILSESYPHREGFKTEEICFVEKCLFLYESNEYEMDKVLRKAEKHGKVTQKVLLWKFVPPVEVKESPLR